MPEQRRAPRFDIRLPLRLLRVGTQFLTRALETETKNLSSLGVLFRNDAQIRVGEPIEYIITMPGKQGESPGTSMRCLVKVFRNETG